MYIATSALRRLLGVGRAELLPGQADADARARVDLLAVDVVLELECAQNPPGDVSASPSL